MKLEDKVAIVTGGNRGIGEAIAWKLAREGAKVVLVARAERELFNVRQELLDAGMDAEAIKADVSDPEQVEHMVRQIIEQYGRVDILVNNAGSAGPTKPVEEISPEEWENVIGSNLKSAFLCSRSVVPHMKSQRWGRIINLSSISGKRPLPFRSGYSAAKMGIIVLTRTLAAELGEFNITVNAICPGFVNGERIAHVIEKQSLVRRKPSNEVQREFISLSPLRRFVEPEHVAATVAFLASEDGASMTGEDVNVSAGVVMY